MLTINMDIGDRLINGSIGTVMYMNNVATNQVAEGIIYVKCDKMLVIAIKIIVYVVFLNNVCRFQ